MHKNSIIALLFASLGWGQSIPIAAPGLMTEGGPTIVSSVPTPIFHHSFNNDGGTGTTATADQGDDCTLINHAWTADGAGGNAVDFDGSSTRASCGSALDGLTTFTVAAWMNADTYGENALGLILGKHTSTTASSWFLRMNDASGTSDFFQAAFCNSSGGIGSGTFADCDAFNAPVDSMDACVGTATWCHIAVVFTACDDLATCDAQLYLDGSPVTTTRGNNPTGSPHSDAAYDVEMGHQGTGGNNVFDGDLDEVKAWSSALSDAQISAVHAAGR